jgi:hypothetical protein
VTGDYETEIVRSRRNQRAYDTIVFRQLPPGDRARQSFATSRGISVAGNGETRWTDRLWAAHDWSVLPVRSSTRQNIARDKPGRHPNRTAEQVRACRQSNSRKGNRPGYSGELRPARRQVDRMKRPLPDMALFGHRIVGL